VVVLDHLVAGVVVGCVGGPDAGQLVGGDGDASAAAAHEDAAVGVGCLERVGDGFRDERVVDALGWRGVVPVEERLVARRPDGVGDGRSQRETRVIGGDRDLHCPAGLRMRSAGAHSGAAAHG
jgi:hypothetical protein